LKHHLAVRNQRTDVNQSNSHPSKPRRVLVVDDDQDIVDSMEMVLQLMGHEVETATRGVDAVEVTERFRPEFIILDIGMPGVNGFDACQRIRETEWGKSIVIIAFTGWSSTIDREKAKAAGFDVLLSKPMEFVELERIVNGFG
jgi:DNA-binding response OmpR family regulator